MELEDKMFALWTLCLMLLSFTVITRAEGGKSYNHYQHPVCKLKKFPTPKGANNVFPVGASKKYHSLAEMTICGGCPSIALLMAPFGAETF